MATLAPMNGFHMAGIGGAAVGRALMLVHRQAHLFEVLVRQLFLGVGVEPVGGVCICNSFRQRWDMPIKVVLVRLTGFS